MTNLPVCGSVLGIDVGFSARAASTVSCLLTWDTDTAQFRLTKARTDSASRRHSLTSLLESVEPSGPRQILAVAIDGPLTHGLVMVREYRTAEALLSQGMFQKRGKPGQTSSPTGLLLHEHATRLARLLLELETEGVCSIAPASHIEPIHHKALVEAFPSQFLAALVSEETLPRLHRDASDRYWEACHASHRLVGLLDGLLPGREIHGPFRVCADHDERAAIVCALTALCVAAGHAVGVGDSDFGDIILPPRSAWGRSATSDERWMERALNESLAKVRRRHPHGLAARIWGSAANRLAPLTPAHPSRDG